jgi:hypothetical protein
MFYEYDYNNLASPYQFNIYIYIYWGITVLLSLLVY